MRKRKNERSFAITKVDLNRIFTAFDESIIVSYDRQALQSKRTKRTSKGILSQTEQYARMYDINQSAEERCVRIGPSCFETAARSLQSVAYYEICKEQFRIVR